MGDLASIDGELTVESILTHLRKRYDDGKRTAPQRTFNDCITARPAALKEEPLNVPRVSARV